MIKEKIVKQLIDHVQHELDKAQKAADTAKAHHQSDEMKQEGKYDTRAIEAGYLAGAQLKRVEELKLELKMLEEIELRAFSEKDAIAIGAIVDLELNDKVQRYFVSSTASGSFTQVDGHPFLVVSVFSPIGNAALGLFVGDSFELETPKGLREYSITAIC
jgi:transcription elongation GreA/GreB family factor